MFNLKILQKDNAFVGTDVYRANDVAVPAAYRAGLVHSHNINQNGSNHQVTIKSTVPVVTVIDGISQSNNAFLGVIKFSSLQSITSDTEREACYDNLIAYAIVAKANILSGTLPDEPIVVPTLASLLKP